jgi:hypothetical protein
LLLCVVFPTWPVVPLYPHLDCLRRHTVFVLSFSAFLSIPLLSRGERKDEALENALNRCLIRGTKAALVNGVNRRNLVSVVTAKLYLRINDLQLNRIRIFLGNPRGGRANESVVIRTRPTSNGFFNSLGLDSKKIGNRRQGGGVGETR